MKELKKNATQSFALSVSQIIICDFRYIYIFFNSGKHSNVCENISIHSNNYDVYFNHNVQDRSKSLSYKQ